MRSRQVLRELLVRYRAQWGEMLRGHAMPVGLLRPRRVLCKRVHGRMHGLQPDHDAWAVCGRRRQGLGSAAQVRRDPVHHLWHHGNLREGGLRLLELELRGGLLCQHIFSHAGLDLRRGWVMCFGGRGRVYQPDVRVGGLSGRMRARSVAMLRQRCADLHGNGYLGGGGRVLESGVPRRRMYRFLFTRQYAMFGQQRPGVWLERDVGDRSGLRQQGVCLRCMPRRLCTRQHTMFG